MKTTHANPAQPFLIVLIMLIIPGIFMDVSAQGVLLIADNQKTHEQVPILIGHHIVYNTFSSKKYERGQITHLTDSTLSVLEEKTMEERTLTYKDLKVIKLQINSVKKKEAVLISAFGAAGIYDSKEMVASSFNNTLFDTSTSPGSAAIDMSMMAETFTHPIYKKINLKKNWKLRIEKAPPKKLANNVAQLN